jgi:hypothetical protein
MPLKSATFKKMKLRFSAENGFNDDVTILVARCDFDGSSALPSAHSNSASFASSDGEEIGGRLFKFQE